MSSEDKNITELILSKMKKKGTTYMLGTSSDLLSNLKGRIPSGCAPLDAIMGGGWPVGRIIELYGDQSTGKSLLILQAIAGVQSLGGTALLLDCEMTMSMEIAEAVGVDINKVIIAYPTTIEQVFEHCNEYISAKKQADKELGYFTPGLVGWDSIASTTTEDEVNAVEAGGLNKVVMSPHARTMSKMLRLVAREFSMNGVTGLFTNQTREKIGVMFGEKTSTIGGKALDFYSSVRVQLIPIRPHKRNAEIVGQEVRARVTKNKVGRPFGTCEFPILFGSGADDAYACFLHLRNFDLIRVSGAWHYIELNGNEVKFQKKDWRKSIYTDNLEEIHNMVMSTNVYIDTSEDSSEDDDE